MSSIASVPLCESLSLSQRVELAKEQLAVLDQLEHHLRTARATDGDNPAVSLIRPAAIGERWEEASVQMAVAQV